MQKFGKYTQNLHFANGCVYSYNTKVSEVKDNKLVVLGYWSMTTTKHINYAAKELGLVVVKP